MLLSLSDAIRPVGDYTTESGRMANGTPDLRLPSLFEHFPRLRTIYDALYKSTHQRELTLSFGQYTFPIPHRGRLS